MMSPGPPGSRLFEPTVTWTCFAERWNQRWRCFVPPRLFPRKRRIPSLTKSGARRGVFAQTLPKHGGSAGTKRPLSVSSRTRKLNRAREMAPPSSNASKGQPAETQVWIEVAPLGSRIVRGAVSHSFGCREMRLSPRKGRTPPLQRVRLHSSNVGWNDHAPGNLGNHVTRFPTTNFAYIPPSPRHPVTPSRGSISASSTRGSSAFQLPTRNSLCYTHLRRPESRVRSCWQSAEAVRSQPR